MCQSEFKIPIFPIIASELKLLSIFVFIAVLATILYGSDFLRNLLVVLSMIYAFRGMNLFINIIPNKYNFRKKIELYKRDRHLLKIRFEKDHLKIYFLDAGILYRKKKIVISNVSVLISEKDCLIFGNMYFIISYNKADHFELTQELQSRFITLPEADAV